MEARRGHWWNICQKPCQFLSESQQTSHSLNSVLGRGMGMIFSGPWTYASWSAEGREWKTVPEVGHFADCFLISSYGITSISRILKKMARDKKRILSSNRNISNTTIPKSIILYVTLLYNAYFILDFAHIWLHKMKRFIALRMKFWSRSDTKWNPAVAVG